MATCHGDDVVDDDVVGDDECDISLVYEYFDALHPHNNSVKENGNNCVGDDVDYEEENVEEDVEDINYSDNDDDDDSNCDDVYESTHAENLAEEIHPLSYVNFRKVGGGKKKTTKQTTATNTTTNKTTNKITYLSNTVIDHTLIKCNKCGKCALIYGKKIICRYCGLRKIYDYRKKCEFFLETPFLGKTVWGSDLSHIQKLENFVQKLEYSREPIGRHAHSNSSMAARLPWFYRSDSKREMLLKKIRKLRMMAEKEYVYYNLRSDTVC